MATQSSWRSPNVAAATAAAAGAGASSGLGNTNTSTNTASTPRWGPGAQRNAHAPSPGQAPLQAQQANTGMSNGSSASPAAPSGASTAGTKDSADAVQRDRIMFLLVGLVGNTIVAHTRAGEKYVGILTSTSTPEGAAGVGIVLSCAQLVGKDESVGPLKKSLIIKADELDSFHARDVGLDVPVSTAKTSNAGFRTDTEISKSAFDALSEGRTLMKWSDDSLDEPLESSALGGGKSGGTWDQFATNEAKFGVRSNYEETLYTTKLDRSGKDFKERERKADQLAREIMGSAPTNTHIAEERNMVPEGQAGPTEEDRYGAVVRSGNAYVPPQARCAPSNPKGAQPTNGSAVPPSSVPAAPVSSADQQPVSTSAEQPAPPTIVTTAPGSAPLVVKDGSAPPGAQQATQHSQQDAFGEFQKFVSQERERLERRKAALVKKEKDTKLADLKSWSDSFKLKYPVPDDIAQNRPAKQSWDLRASEGPRNPSLQKSLSPTLSTTAQMGRPDTIAEEGSRSASAHQSPRTGADARQGHESKTGAVGSTKPAHQRLADTKMMLSKMTIPKIPPFNPEKARARQAELVAAQAAPVAGGSDTSSSSTAASNSKSAFRMSAKASAFKPFNPNASAFTPGAPAASVVGPAQTSVSGAAAATASASPVLGTQRGPAALPFASPRVTSTLTPASAASSSPAPKPAVPVNPFFGTRVIKKSQAPLHVRDDFNLFKTGKVPDASTVGPKWAFSGKSYRQLFHAIPPEDTSGPVPSGANAAGPSHAAGPSRGVANAGAGASGQGNGSANVMMHANAGQQPLPHGVSNLPLHMQYTSPQPHHPQQFQHQQQHMPPHAGQVSMPHSVGGAANMNQPFYMPYGPYRFQGGHQPVQQVPGAPYGMPPQMMGQMPFSPPMPHAGPPAGMYSPQMPNVIPSGPMPNMVAAGGPRGGGNQGLPHMQPKVPPHMYYQAQPMQGVPYGSPFPQGAGPSPAVRHQQPQQQMMHHPHAHPSSGVGAGTGGPPPSAGAGAGPIPGPGLPMPPTPSGSSAASGGGGGGGGPAGPGSGPPSRPSPAPSNHAS